MSSSKIVSAFQRYAFAIILVGITAFLRVIAQNWVGNHYSFMIFLPAVLLGVLYGGLGPGLLAALSGGMIADYFFLDASHGFKWDNGFIEGRIFVYLTIALLTCVIVSQLRTARKRAEANEKKLQDQIEERMRAELNLREEMGERQRVETALKDTLEKAELASRAKSEFLANMSHEIRTPMNAVVGISDILAMGVPLTPEKHKELLHTLQLSAKAMMSIIDDLLDISKIENEQVELEKRMFDLRGLAEEIVAILRVQAQKKDILLTLEYDDLLNHRRFLGDTTRLRQIIMNLVGNAVKFTEHGSVTLRVRCCEGERGDGSDVCFEVLDTGIGIQEDKLDSVFSKFSQADTSITRKFGGTGLGLAISKMLVEMMGGEINVASKVGVGTLFKVYLKIGAPKGLEAELPMLRLAQNKFGEWDEIAHTCMILIVEDNNPNILIVTTLLGHLNYAYRLARNGRDAIELVQKQAFDLILMDIQMPVVDGYHATEQIRLWERNEGRERTPIIGVTAHALSDDKVKCLKAGMDDYISKPFSHTDLEMKIASLIYKRKHQKVA